MLEAWRPLAAAAAAAVGLAEQLGSTAAGLQLERVDVALAASDSRERMLQAAGACWAGASAPGQQPEQRQAAAARLALAFAAFSDDQSAAVLQLAAGDLQQTEADAQGPLSAEAAAVVAAADASSVLDGVQRLVLGYATTAVAVRDATSEVLFSAPDGSNQLSWLSQAVQAADSISTTAAELQLLLPPLMALLHTPAAAAQVSAAVTAAAEVLEDEEEGQEAAEEEQEEDEGQPQAAREGQLAAAAADEQAAAAAAAMQLLLEAAEQHPALAGLLQGLQQAQAAAQLLLPPNEQPLLPQQQLLLAAAVVSAWQELEDSVAAAAAAESSSSIPEALAAAGPAAWQQCSAVLAAAVAEEVSQHLLPPLAAALGSTAEQLRSAGPSLARRAGLDAAAAAQASGWEQAAPSGSAAAQQLQEQQAAAAAPEPELVAFTDFDSEAPGAGMLLGGLEDELEPAGQPGVDGSGGADLVASQPGGTGAGLSLVPFLDFDDGLAGTGGRWRRLAVLHEVPACPVCLFLCSP